jgi:hypothetical protein
MHTNKTTAFRVSVNGKRLCVAGIAGDCVLSAILSHVFGNGRDETFLRVGGLESAVQEHVVWAHQNIKIGDEIRIKVLAGNSIDEPKNRERRDPKEDIKQQKRYVKRMAREFGWELKTKHAK